MASRAGRLMRCSVSMSQSEHGKVALNAPFHEASVSSLFIFTPPSNYPVSNDSVVSSPENSFIQLPNEKDQLSCSTRANAQTDPAHLSALQYTVLSPNAGFSILPSTFSFPLLETEIAHPTTAIQEGSLFLLGDTCLIILLSRGNRAV